MRNVLDCRTHGAALATYLFGEETKYTEVRMRLLLEVSRMQARATSGYRIPHGGADLRDLIF